MTTTFPPTRRGASAILSGTTLRLILFAAAWAAVVGWTSARAQPGGDAAATAAPPAPAAQTGQTGQTGRARAVQVANAGKRNIVAVYASAPGRDDWGSDMLGKQTLKPGGSASLKLGDASTGCRLDFSALLDNGDTRTRADVNVCAATPQIGF